MPRSVGRHRTQSGQAASERARGNVVAAALRKPGTRRAMWAGGNELVESGSNFLLAIWIGRQVSPHEFGAFALVYSGLQVAWLAERAVAPMPMMVKFAASEQRMARSLAAAVTGVCVAVALVASVAFLGIGVADSGPLRATALAAAVVAPGLLLQDCCVYLFYNRKQPHLALLNNGIWLVAQVAVFIGIGVLVAHRHAWMYVLAWGLCAYLAVGVSLLQLHVAPALSRVARWWTEHRSTIVDLVAENGTGLLAQQGSVWAFGGVAGLSGVAGFRAAQVPLGVPRVLLQGLTPIGLAEGARLYDRRPRSLVMFVRLWSVATVLFTAVVGVVLIVMPASAGRALVGASWDFARPILLAVTVVVMANALMIPAQTGLKAMGATRRSARLRTITCPLPAIGVVVGHVLGGYRGAALGVAVASLAAAIAAMIAFAREYRSRQTASAVARPAPAAPEPALRAESERP